MKVIIISQHVTYDLTVIKNVLSLLSLLIKLIWKDNQGKTVVDKIFNPVITMTITAQFDFKISNSHY